MGNAQLQCTYGHVLVLSSRRLVRPAVDDDFEYGKRSQKKKKKGKKKVSSFCRETTGKCCIRCKAITK